MTMATANAIANAITIGMDFDTALATVKGFTDDIDITTPDDVNFGSIIAGNIYGNSVTIDFDGNDLVDNIDVDDGDWD